MSSLCIKHICKSTSLVFPENTKDLDFLLLRSRIWVVCAVVRTLLFITSLRESSLCSSVYDTGEVQLLGRLPVIKWMYVSEFYKPVSPILCSHCLPALLNKNINLWGCTKAMRQRIHGAFRGHPQLSRVLLSCVYVIASVTTAVFPMLRLTACKWAKFTVVYFSYLQRGTARMLASYIKSIYSLEQVLSRTIYFIKKCNSY